MNPLKHPRSSLAKTCVIVCLGLAAQSAVQAQLMVNLSSTALGGGVYQYEYTVINGTLQELAFLSITDAPSNDPLIGSTLYAPAGYATSYDPNVGMTFGFIDSLPDVSFAAGSTVSGFGFQSGAAPQGFFDVFFALTVDGDTVQGRVNRVSVPDTGSTLGLAIFSATGILLARRKFKTT